MHGFVALAESLIVERLMSSGVPFTGRTKVELGLYALAGLFFITALGFFFYGSFLWINKNYPPETAAILIGCMALVMALLSALGGYSILCYRRSQIRKVKEDITNVLQDSMIALEKELITPLQENPKTAILAGVLTGYIAGSFIKK